jgi:hypothetical protein
VRVHFRILASAEIAAALDERIAVIGDPRAKAVQPELIDRADVVVNQIVTGTNFGRREIIAAVNQIVVWMTGPCF